MPLYRDYINKLRPPVKGVTIKIRKPFRETETSIESLVRTSNYVKYLNVPGYEPGIQYGTFECLNINDDCMFKIDKLESAFCNDCGHTTNNDGVYTDQSLHLEDLSNIQTISRSLYQLMDLRREYLENYRCADGCQKLNTSTKALHVTQLSGGLIIQIYDGISKKVVPNLSNDKEISVLGNRMVLSGVIYHEGEQSHCGHYSWGVKVNNTWFLISDTRILRKQKLLCSSKDISIPYVLTYEKIANLLTALPNSLNGTAEVGSTPELITETPETVFQQSVLQKQEKQKAKSTLV